MEFEHEQGKSVDDCELMWSHKPTANSNPEEGYEQSLNKKNKWLRQGLDVTLAVVLQDVLLPATYPPSLTLRLASAESQCGKAHQVLS